MQQLELLLGLFIIIFIGFLAAKFKIISRKFTKDLNRYIFYVAATAIIFTSLATSDKSSIGNYPKFIIVNFIIAGILRFGAVLLKKLLNRKVNFLKTIFYPSFAENCFYFGMPIIFSLLGEAHFEYLLIYLSFNTSLHDLLAFIGLEMMNTEGEKVKFKEIFKNIIKNPIIWATIFGFLFMIFEIQIPTMLQEGLEKIGSTTSPLALFSLGIFIYYNLSIKDIQTFKLAMVPVITKLMIVPAVVLFFVTQVFQLSDIASETSVAIACMPSAVFSLVVADMYDLDKKLTTAIVVLSSIIFLVTSIFWFGLLK